MLYNKPLKYYAQKFTYDEQDAEDAVMYAYLKIGTYDEMNEREAKTFLYKAVKLRCFNKIKWDSKHEEDHNEMARIIDHEYADASYVKSNLLGIIWEEVSKLSQREKEVMVLMFKQGLTARQISELIGIDTSTIGVLKKRALKKLRQLDL